MSRCGLTVTLSLLQLISKQTSITTQTDPDISDRTQLKRLAASSSLGPLSQNGHMTNGSPLPHPHASSAVDLSIANIPIANASTANSPIVNASTANSPSSITGSMFYQTGSEKSLGLVVSASRLPPEDTASGSNGLVEASSAAKSVSFNNCTFQWQSNTNTHNNTIGKLNEMNVSNSHSTHLERPNGAHAAGLPPDIPMIELPAENIETGVRGQSNGGPQQEPLRDEGGDDDRS